MKRAVYTGTLPQIDSFFYGLYLKPELDVRFHSQKKNIGFHISPCICRTDNSNNTDEKEVR